MTQDDLLLKHILIQREKKKSEKSLLLDWWKMGILYKGSKVFYIYEGGSKQAPASSNIERCVRTPSHIAERSPLRFSSRGIFKLQIKRSLAGSPPFIYIRK